MASIEKEIKSKSFDNPYERVIVNLLFTSNKVESALKEVLLQFGITNPQYNILRILNGAFPNPVSPGRIKEVMLFKGSDLTRLLDRLVNKELVHRSICPTNRRMVELFISEKGKQTLNAIQPKLFELFESYESRLTKREAVQLSNLLDKLRS